MELPFAFQGVIAILTLVVGFLIAKYLSEFIRDLLKTDRIMKRLKPHGYSEAEVDFMTLLLRYLIYVIAILAAMAQFALGLFIIQIVAIIFVVIMFLVLSYSLKEFIPNAAAGMYINRNKMIEIGDDVSVDEYRGKVKDISLLSTTIVTADNQVVIIPNSIVTRRKIIKSYIDKINSLNTRNKFWSRKTYSSKKK